MFGAPAGFGVALAERKQFDEAIAFYEKAAMENPKEPVYRLALDRVRVSASLFHIQEARKLVAKGQRDAAAAEYGRALALNPRDTQTALEARKMTIEPPQEEPKPEKIEYPIKLKGRDAPIQARFGMESSLRSIFTAVGRSAGINILFDENFRDIPYAPDLSSQTLEGALKVLCQATKNFYRIIDERTVVVIPDTPMKRIQYDVNVIKTFYLTNVAADTLDCTFDPRGGGRAGGIGLACREPLRLGRPFDLARALRSERRHGRRLPRPLRPLPRRRSGARVPPLGPRTDQLVRTGRQGP